ncbi:hypothetical protein HDU76_001697 [Blyttiomyces sp. JEL0837]|nr:hypothetical protein HDU76_001697 [Blyttiomyces sp. JEL0837]
MSNHQTLVDWWYFWIVAWKKGAHGDIKIILKDSLKWIPVVGWGMQCFDFIFLARKWSVDEPRLKTSLSSTILEDPNPIWLLVFPEGTVITADTLEKTLAHRAKTPTLLSHPPPRNLIIPRTTGLWTCSRILTGHDLTATTKSSKSEQTIVDPSKTVSTLLDVTMGFSDTTSDKVPYDRFPILDVFLGGMGPRQVHFNIKSHDLTKLPGMSSDAAGTTEQQEGFAEWVCDRFRKKDAMLDGFYARGEFTVEGLKPDEKDANRVVINAVPTVTDFVTLGLTYIVGYSMIYYIWKIFVYLLFGW